MGLFVKKNEINIQEDTVILPKNEIKFDDCLINSFFESILELGEEEDLRVVLKKAGEVLYLKNKELLTNNEILKNDDLELVVTFLNLFLSNNKLGNIKVLISKSNKEIKLIHNNFTFINNYSVSIVLLEEFYSHLFSDLLNQKILVKGEKGENDEIVFKIVY